MWKPHLGPAERCSDGLKWLGSRTAAVYINGQQGLTSSHDVATQSAFCSDSFRLPNAGPCGQDQSSGMVTGLWKR